jgi:cytidylate kinase
MKSSLFDGCKSYIAAQSARPGGKPPETILPAITISREAGAGALTIAQRAADEIERRIKIPEYPWAIFDRNLVEQVLQDHDLPQRIKRFMPEDSMVGFTAGLEELLGLHPGAWTLFEHTTDTILRLATAGHCILVGRGANIITRHLKNVFHVRLVAPVERRVDHCEKFYNLTRREALVFISHADAARRRYVQQHFHTRIDDPLQYHLTINTGKMSFDAAAMAIADGVMDMRSRFETAPV